jgi:phospholipid-binding lipoprotein MlaA
VTLAQRFKAAGSAALLLGAILGGCATPPSDPAQRAIYAQNNDPFEPLNRHIFAFNEFVDHAVILPVAKAYVFAVPAMGRDGIHNLLDNMKEPTLFFNNLLQGEFKRAGITVARFAVNTAFGIGGLVDLMALSGVPRQPADFGQTLYVWGVASGPYLVLPIFGPSNPRDAIGQGVDSYADPFTIVANDHGLTQLMTARLLIGGIDDRSQVIDELDAVEKNSVDFYASLRSMAQQHRAAQLRHDQAAPQETPNLYNDPGKSAPSSAPASPPLPTAPRTPPHNSARPASLAATTRQKAIGRVVPAGAGVHRLPPVAVKPLQHSRTAAAAKAQVPAAHGQRRPT